MTEPDGDIVMKVMGNAAEEFMETYYRVLNGVRTKSALSDFYVKKIDGALKSEICLNGKVIKDWDELEKVFTKDIEECHYDVQSWNCLLINKNYNVDVPEKLRGPDKDGKKISFSILVSGVVKFSGENLSGEEKPFSETFILVPSWQANGPKAARNARKWHIVSQNFRMVG